MGDLNTDEFLDLYRRLENAAESVVGSGRGSSVFRQEKHRDFAAYSDQIACFREVRNFLSHEPKFGGEYAIHPNKSVVESLRALLELVENPPRVRFVYDAAEQSDHRLANHSRAAAYGKDAAESYQPRADS